MYRYIWLVPLLPLAGAALNGIFGRWFRFSEKLIGGIAVGTVALSFLISLSAVYSYGFGGNSQWPNPYITTQTAFNWIPAGAVKQTLGQADTSTTISVANQPVKVATPRASLLNIEWSVTHGKVGVLERPRRPQQIKAHVVSGDEASTKIR